MSAESTFPIDEKAPVSFLVGMAAGLSGLDHHWAAVVVLGFQATTIMLDEGVDEVFERSEHMSYGTQITEMLAGLAGAYLGKWLSERNQHAAVAMQNPGVSGVSPFYRR